MCFFSEKLNGECIKNIDDGMSWKILQQRIPSAKGFTISVHGCCKVFSSDSYEAVSTNAIIQ